MKERGEFRYLGIAGVALVLVLVGHESATPVLPNVSLSPQLAISNVASTTTSTSNADNSTTVSTLLIPGTNGEQIIIKLVNQPRIKIEVPASQPSQYGLPSTTLLPSTTTAAPTTATSTTTTEATLPKLSWSSWSYGPYWNQSGQGASNGAIFMPLGTLKLAASVAGLPTGTLSFTVGGGPTQMVNMNGPDYYGSNDCSAVHNWSGQASGGCSITFSQSGTYSVRTNYLGESISQTVNVS